MSIKILLFEDKTSPPTPGTQAVGAGLAMRAGRHSLGERVQLPCHRPGATGRQGLSQYRALALHQQPQSLQFEKTCLWMSGLLLHTSRFHYRSLQQSIPTEPTRSPASSRGFLYKPARPTLFHQDHDGKQLSLSGVWPLSD